MARTSAERQAAYRDRRDEVYDRRLVSWVTSETYHALKRLARKAGTSKRAVLESLILAADDVNLRACETDEELDEYLGATT